MDPTQWSGREIMHIGPKGVRRWRATLAGKKVETAAWTGAGKPRSAVKEHASREAAGVALIKALRKKMLEDFVYLRPDAGPGELVFAMALPGGGPADNFDLTPDGQVLVVGAGRGDPRALLVRASLATGEVERIDVAPDPGHSQLFIHGALVDPAGAAITYGLNDDVRRLDLGTRAWRAIASVRHRGHEHVNPFCVEPQRDADHRRILLVNGPKLEVRDLVSDAVLFAAPIGTRTAECRRIALSPSGALAAAHVISRHLVYHHDDARGDRTNEIQIWRVDDGEVIARLGREGLHTKARAIDVQITRLRRKLEDDPKAPKYLQTVRGSGYMLVAD